MIGLLVQLAASWLLLWLVGKKDLRVLGLVPARIRLLDFSFGFIVAAILFTLYCLTTTALTSNAWSLNGDYAINHFLSSTAWILNSVLFEEFIFRGAFLYVLLQKIGEPYACGISAVCFGIYHWFSYGVLGNPVPMVYVFVSTGIWGLMFAFAFSRTQSMYLPIGLHLGWNLFNIVIFSQGPLGHQFLISSNNGTRVTGFGSAGLQLFQILALPAFTYFYLKGWRPKAALAKG